MSEPTPPTGGSSTAAEFIEHLFSMPKHHKALLTVALLLFGSGLPGWAQNYFANNNTSSAQTAPAVAPGDPKYMVSDSATQPNQSDDQNSLYRKISPTMFHLGAAFTAGFVIGWIFRAFLKMMALLTTVGVAILVGLSYFHILNIDFTAVKTKYQSDMAWVSDQAERAANALVHRFAGSASGFAGMFFGFKRK